ncbi:MAG TPA: hypothetical protein VKW04_08415 [Planctomycetota bacterium]|nr:hypothetical protein [Planctomycetota bacterium]
MMKRWTTPTVTLELGFTDKNEPLKLLQTLAQDARVAVNIVKARITEDSAWLELELKGPSPRLLEVASLLNDAATQKDPGWRPVSRAS